MLTSLKRIGLPLAAAFLLSINSYAQYKPGAPAVIRVSMDQEIGPMKPIWAWFGYDEDNYTYMKDGKKLLGELAALSPGPLNVRTHNLLTTGDGTPPLKGDQLIFIPRMPAATRFIIIGLSTVSLILI